MKCKECHNIRLGACLTCVLLLGASFLLMPIEGSGAMQKYMSFLPGIVFWGSLVGEIISYVCFASGIKKQIDPKGKPKGTLGLIAFFKNKYAIVADLTMIVSFLGTIAAMLLTDGTKYICYLFVALFVWSFSMHCVCNGGAFNRWLCHNKDSHMMNAAVRREGKK